MNAALSGGPFKAGERKEIFDDKPARLLGVHFSRGGRHSWHESTGRDQRSDDLGHHLVGPRSDRAAAGLIVFRAKSSREGAPARLHHPLKTSEPAHHGGDAPPGSRATGKRADLAAPVTATAG